MRISDKIKEQRLKKEWTQEQLGELLNVSRSTISSWEVGRNYPDLEMVVAISDLFGISLDELLRGDREMTKEVSKRMKWNKYYKRILIGVGIVILAAAISTFKLRKTESMYLNRLAADGWTNDDVQFPRAFSLKEESIVYSTYVLETGWNPIPLQERHLWIITRKDPLVVERKEDGLYVFLSPDNDPKMTYTGGVKVDEKANILEMNDEWSDKKQKTITAYIKKHQAEYAELLKKSNKKYQDIVNG